MPQQVLFIISTIQILATWTFSILSLTTFYQFCCIVLLTFLPPDLTTWTTCVSALVVALEIASERHGLGHGAWNTCWVLFFYYMGGGGGFGFQQVPRLASFLVHDCHLYFFWLSVSFKWWSVQNPPTASSIVLLYVVMRRIGQFGVVISGEVYGSESVSRRRYKPSTRSTGESSTEKELCLSRCTNNMFVSFHNQKLLSEPLYCLSNQLLFAQAEIQLQGQVPLAGPDLLMKQKRRCLDLMSGQKSLVPLVSTGRVGSGLTRPSRFHQ